MARDAFEGDQVSYISPDGQSRVPVYEANGHAVWLGESSSETWTKENLPGEATKPACDEADTPTIIDEKGGRPSPD